MTGSVLAYEFDTPTTQNSGRITKMDNVSFQQVLSIIGIGQSHKCGQKCSKCLTVPIGQILIIEKRMHQPINL